MQFFRLAWSIALAALFALPCSAQYVIKRLVFKDAQPYKQAQLESATGLKIGQHIGPKDVADAAQRLMDTGVFADIDTSLNGPVAGIDVIFKLTPADAANMLPVSFENIVWLTPEEREAGLMQTVPLYGEKLPAAGSLQNAVQAALQQMLTVKGITATVTTLQEASTTTRPTAAIVYRVTQPKVVVSNVKLGGVAADLAPEERKAIQTLVGASFNEGIDAHLPDTLLAAYRNAGYLDATLQGFTRTPADNGQGTTQVTLSAQVVAGDSYRVSSVQWPTAEFFSADDFSKASKLHAGDIASSAALEASYRPLLDAYLQRGYLDVVVIPLLQFDRVAHTVAYTLDLQPGAVYRVGTFNVRGLSPQARKDFDSAWKLKPGIVYDAIYATNFLHLNTALKSLDPYTGKVDTVAHPETHTVDVTMTFFANNRM